MKITSGVITRLIVVGSALLHLDVAAAIKYIAHRGVPLEQVENTLPSLEAAAKLGGVWAVELDVKGCKPGELVVFHDETTGRLAAVDKAVEKMPLVELQALELRYKPSDLYHNIATQGLVGNIPTLEQVLAMLTALGERRPNVVLDIKSDGIADRVADVIARFCENHDWQAGQFWCIGPKYNELERVYQNNPSVKIVPLIYDEAVAGNERALATVLDEIQAFGACGVLLIERTAAAAESVKARGMQVWMGFVEERPEVVAGHAFQCVDAMILNTIAHMPEAHCD